MRWSKLISAGSVCLGLMAGCAAGGDPGDGGSNLPERGFAGYAPVVDAEEAPVEPLEVAEGVELGDPFARVVGGRVELFVSRCLDGSLCHIARADSDDGLRFGGLETVAEAAEGLTAPYVVGRLLYAVSGDGAAIVEVDLDSGERRTVLASDGGRLDAPSVVEAHGEWLYVTLEDEADHRVLRTPLGASTLEPVALPGLPDVWEPDAILQPEVRAATTGAGRSVLRMVYAGRYDGDVDLAFAASFDGIGFSNWPFDPALAGGADTVSPSNIRFGDRYLLYYGRRGGRLGIAERTADNPTEVF